MKTKVITDKRGLKINKSYEARPLERILVEAMTSGEPINMGEKPGIFTEKKDGVNSSFDIRRDKFAEANKALNKMNKSREARAQEIADRKLEPKASPEAES